MHFYRQLPKIRAMTFDLDDTLYDNRPVIAHLEQQMIEWMAQHHPVSITPPLSWWSELKQNLANRDPELRHDVTHWRYQQLKQGLELLGYDETKATLAAQQAIDEVLRLRNLIDVPDITHQILSELAEKIPLIAITNGNADPDKIGLGDYFQAVLKAGPDGYAKPYPDLFSKAQQQLALPPASILHVGDHLRTDVLGAWRNNFSSCWFNDQPLNLLQAKRARILPDIEVSHLAELVSLV
jgi:putative hydrolase of the HAD superfamily